MSIHDGFDNRQTQPIARVGGGITAAMKTAE
jgi:hypothetical protein